MLNDFPIVRGALNGLFNGDATRGVLIVWGAFMGALTDLFNRGFY